MTKRVLRLHRKLYGEPLSMEISEDRYSYSGQIAVPNLPSSIIKESKFLQQENVGGLDMGKEAEYVPLPLLRQLERELKTNGKALSLQGFYLGERTGKKSLKGKLERDARTKSEQLATRGLGKDMLCTMLTHLVEQDPTLDQALMTLHAEGGSCAPAESADPVSSESRSLLESAEAEPSTVDFTLSQLRNYVREMTYKSPKRDETRDDWMDFMSREELLFLICLVKDNEKLVEYYNKTYGFQRFDPLRSSSVLMATKVHNVLEHCKQNIR